MSEGFAQAIQAWRTGDARAFETIYAELAPGLAAYCHLLCGHPAAASDLFQDTWAQAIRASASYREQGNGRAWLCTLARHLWLNQHRRTGLERRSIPWMGRSLRLETPPGLGARELAVRETLSRMVPEDREILLLYDLQKLTLREIAAVLEISHVAVRSRLARARQRFMDLFGPLD